jgi:multidrug efflux system membrane fusion protein
VLLSAIGNVQARTTVSVKSRVDGQIVEVAVREGQRVKKGDLLFRIDPRPFEAQLRQAEANLARDQANLTKAEADLARYQSLSEKGYSSQQRYEEATALKSALIATIAAQEAAIEIARLNLEFANIHSPVDGRAGNVLVHAGNLVEANADDPMLVITETQPIFVAFSVPERHLARIKQRMGEGLLTVEVTIPDEGGPPITGEIFFINNAVDMTTGTIQLKARFDNQKERLTPGQFVEVRIKLAEIHQAIVVPSQAVQRSQKGPFVYVVKDDKTVDMRMIETGPSVDARTVVTNGLASGETIVTDGQLRLFPGRNVAPKPKSDGDGKGAPPQS